MLDAFKLGWDMRSRSSTPRSNILTPMGCARAVRSMVATELRAYVATMTYEDLP